MATELLSDGIRRFAMDTKKLESIILEKLSLLCFKKQHTVPFIFHSSLSTESTRFLIQER